MNFLNHIIIKNILGFPTLCSLLYLNTYKDKELFLVNPYIIKTALIPLNVVYSYYIYNNRYYYLNLTLDYILNFKLYIQKIFKNDNNNTSIGDDESLHILFDMFERDIGPFSVYPKDSR